VELRFQKSNYYATEIESVTIMNILVVIILGLIFFGLIFGFALGLFNER